MFNGTAREVGIVDRSDRNEWGAVPILLRGMCTGAVLGAGAAITFVVLASIWLAGPGGPAAVAMLATAAVFYAAPVGALAGAVGGTVVSAFARVAGRWLPQLSVVLIVALWVLPLLALGGFSVPPDRWLLLLLPLLTGVPFGVWHAVWLRRWLSVPRYEATGR